MFNNIKKDLYFYKMKLLYNKGLSEGKIIPFDEDFYQSMSNTFINCIPV